MLASACKQLQALSLQVPDSRFKIQDPKRTSWIQAAGFKIQDFQWLSLNPGACIQDWRFKIQDLKRTSWIQRVDSRFKIFTGFSWIQGLGHKIQDSRSKKNFLNPGGRIQDSRFSVALLESRGLDTRLKIQDPKRISWIEGGGFKIQLALSWEGSMCKNIFFVVRLHVYIYVFSTWHHPKFGKQCLSQTNPFFLM